MARSNLKKRAPRFIAMYCAGIEDERYVFDTGWHIFDRNHTTRQGEVCAIARATGKHTARRVCDALNKTEPAV